MTSLLLDRGAAGPSIHGPDHIGDLVCIDPLDHARINVSHLEEGRELGLTSTPLAEEHLPHPPVALGDMLPANDHEVSRTDVKEGSFKLDGEIAVIDGHLQALVLLYS